MPTKQETADRLAYTQECPNHTYYPPILNAVDRIIAIGDLHGDMKLTKQCLELACVINKGTLTWKKWINPNTGKPGSTVVVQVGDQIDRCRPNPNRGLSCTDPNATQSDEDNDVAILELLTKLDKQAAKVGDRLISLLGNHELMNIQGNLKYVSHKGLTSNNKYSIEDGIELRKKSFRKKMGHFIACTRLPCVIVGDFLFVHGGIISDFIKDNNINSRDDMYGVNQTVRKWVLSLIDKEYVYSVR